MCIVLALGLQQLPPAFKEQAAVIQLDRQQVFFGEDLLGQKAITNLSGARTQCIAAIAQYCQPLVIHNARIGSP